MFPLHRGNTWMIYCMGSMCVCAIAAYACTFHHPIAVLPRFAATEILTFECEGKRSLLTFIQQCIQIRIIQIYSYLKIIFTKRHECAPTTLLPVHSSHRQRRHSTTFHAARTHNLSYSHDLPCWKSLLLAR